MSKRVLCKFFAHGACLKGDHCEFSHDWKAPPNNVCTFYQKGSCAYGSRCRYDHVKTKPLPPASSSSTDLPRTVVNVSGTVTNGSAQFSPYDGTDVHSPFHETAQSIPSSGPPHAHTATSWGENSAYFDVQETEGVSYARSINPADQPICSFAAAGDCPHNNDCPHIHGDLCASCGKHCLHPFRPEEREEHIKTCEKRQKHLKALRQSQEIECNVCLERVLLKSVQAERKFGILSECDHAFCISCIRNWRSSSPASGFDVNSALRACPICRKLSYFVIPSVIWYSVKEEKQEIVDSYKAKLRSIDCKHFDFGNGSCPFGTSCFYRHAYRDGRLEEVAVRHLGAEDGSTVIAKSIRLSDFLSNMRLR